MKMSFLVYAKISSIILFLFFGINISANSQDIEKQEYAIDASQHLQKVDRSNRNRPFSISSSAKNGSMAIVINKNLYGTDQIDKLLPLINENKKSIHSIDVITDKATISRYTKDEKITSVMKFKVCNKIARQIKRKNEELVRK